jgi:hypothetical protein
MVAAILINGPLSMAVQRVPSYWEPGAGDRLTTYLHDPSSVDQMLVFFALSNLIFVFAIGFFAGLRSLVTPSDLSGWVRGVVAIGAALFLSGGLLSELLSTGIAVVLRTTPDYHLDINTVLLLQGLWSTAIAPGQVALGVVIITLSTTWLHDHSMPSWLGWLGVLVGAVAVLRPAIITNIPAFIVSFQPLFIWVTAVSIVLLHSSRTRHHPADPAVRPLT